MKKLKADRQGDVTIAHIDNMSIDEALNAYGNTEVKRDKLNRVVLAEGEVTGHAHAMSDDNIKMLRPRDFPDGHSLLVVQETSVQQGALIEGKVIGTMPGGTVRFQRTDGVVIRFAPDDIKVKEGVGVVVKRAHSLLTHDEHDAIPISKGVHHIIQHSTLNSAQRRMRSTD